MNRAWIILFISIFSLSLGGCDETAETNQDQREDIIDYLEWYHDPLLISQSDADESIEIDPPFYSMSGATVFRYIEDYYNSQRESMPEIKSGSEISITYTLYDFEDITDPTTDMILLTNDASQIELLVEEGLNPEKWSSDPYTFKVGSGTLFSGVESALVGCREGDVIEFYVTLSEGYGTSIIGVAAEESPLALFCEILEVNN